MSASPAVTRAMQRAQRSGADRAAVEGFGGFNTRVSVADDGRIVFGRGADGVPTFPNLAFWDAVKRNLDDMAGQAYRVGAKSTGNDLSGLARTLRTELDRLVPQYKLTRSRAAAFFDADDALTAGENFARASRNVDLERAAAQVGGMSKAERELFADGYASAMVSRLNNIPDRRQAVRTLFGSPAQRRRVQIALGNERARRLEARYRLENTLDLARGAFGNSTTARQLADIGLAAGGGAGVGFLSDGNPLGVTVGALAAVLVGRGGRFVANKQRERVAREIAELLLSGSPDDLAKAVQKTASSPFFMNILRKMDPAAARGAAVTGGQEIGAFALGHGNVQE
jgi:hypothetical protein